MRIKLMFVVFCALILITAQITIINSHTNYLESSTCSATDRDEKEYNWIYSLNLAIEQVENGFQIIIEPNVTFLEEIIFETLTLPPYLFFLTYENGSTIWGWYPPQVTFLNYTIGPGRYGQVFKINASKYGTYYLEEHFRLPPMVNWLSNIIEMNITEGNPIYIKVSGLLDPITGLYPSYNSVTTTEPTEGITSTEFGLLWFNLVSNPIIWIAIFFPIVIAGGIFGKFLKNRAKR